MPNSTATDAAEPVRSGGFVWSVGSQALLDADTEESRAQLHAMVTAENEKTAGFMATLKGARERISSALKSRDGEADESLAVRSGSYLYFERWSRGDDHLVYCRRPWREESATFTPNARHVDSVDLLDVNSLAAHRAYFDLGDVGVSPCETLLAWTADTKGDERYRLFIKDLSTGDVLDVSPEFVDAEFEWADTNPPSVTYGKIDDDDRVASVCLHAVGDVWTADHVVYAEDDEAWSCGAYKSRCGRVIFIQTDSFTGNEIRTLDARNPRSRPELLVAREEGLECYPELIGDDLLVLMCDEEHPEFRLFRAPRAVRDRAHWTLVKEPEIGVQLELVEAWRDFYLVSIRQGAAVVIEFFDSQGTFLRRVDAAHPLGEVSCHENPMFDSDVCRLVRTSPVDAERIVSFEPRTGIEKVLWEENPGDDYIASDYAAARTYAPSHDGELVPVSMVWRKDRRRSGGNAVWLEAYGAYDDVADLTLDTDRLALLDAGVIWAVAHVRGGGERGRRWYESGRLDAKFNSIADYLAAVEFLERSGVLKSGLCLAEGRSAGGVVVAGAVQQAPERFCALLAEVPFVDMVNSLVDEELPTTAADRDEFGDPDDPEQLARLFDLSPVENVPRKSLPPLLVSTGLYDTRVPVREALRWVERLRQRAGASVHVLGDTSAGHQGPSGRAAEIARLAEFQAFALWSITRANPAAVYSAPASTSES